MPYFPTEKDAPFQGVMGFAPYSCVFYLYLDPKTWTKESLIETVAHELNHALYFYYHAEKINSSTLLDDMLMEGLAENFRESLCQGNPAPWSVALSKREAWQILKNFTRNDLLSQEENFINGVLFGNDKFAHWSGYSIGYWIVKEFLHKKPELSWDKVLRLSSAEILKVCMGNNTDK